MEKLLTTRGPPPAPGGRHSGEGSLEVPVHWAATTALTTLVNANCRRKTRCSWSGCAENHGTACLLLKGHSTPDTAGSPSQRQSLSLPERTPSGRRLLCPSPPSPAPEPRWPCCLCSDSAKLTLPGPHVAGSLLSSWPLQAGLATHSKQPRVLSVNPCLGPPQSAGLSLVLSSTP